HRKARVPSSCFIGPGCVIGAEVELGEECRLDAHVVIEGPTTIGARNRFFPFNSIGLPPQDLSYQGEATRLEMGEENQIREFCTLHRGTAKGGGVTRIGSHVIMANCSTLAGHVTVGDHATLGAFSPIHQFVRVGPHAYLGGGTITTQDVLPFAITSET